MKDFSTNEQHYKAVQVSNEQGCTGCVFFVNGLQTLCKHLFSIVPHCMKGGKSYIFVETSQNALQQEQEASG